MFSGSFMCKMLVNWEVWTFSSNLIIKNTNVLHTEYLDLCYMHIYIERKREYLENHCFHCDGK